MGVEATQRPAATPLQSARVNAMVAARTTKEAAMPGGRLTQQERQQIAAGLADGLAYAAIAGRLQVSPASVSKAIAFLESQGLVRRERDERRRERYVVDDDVMYQSTMASARATAHLGEIARQGVSILGPGSPAAARLENIARFVDFVSHSIARAAEQAREILHTRIETTADSTS